jgi:hypothetical protein
MKMAMTIGLGLLLVGTATPVLAKKHTMHSTTPQAHHCQLNGAEVHKSKEACKKAGGTWEKGAPTKAAAPTENEPVK